MTRYGIRIKRDPESAGRSAGKKGVLAGVLAKVLFLLCPKESALASTSTTTPASTSCLASTILPDSDSVPGRQDRKFQWSITVACTSILQAVWEEKSSLVVCLITH